MSWSFALKTSLIGLSHQKEPRASSGLVLGPVQNWFQPYPSYEPVGFTLARASHGAGESNVMTLLQTSAYVSAFPATLFNIVTEHVGMLI